MSNNQKSEENNGKQIGEIDSKFEGYIDSSEYIQSFYLLILRDLTDPEKNDKFFKENPQLHSTKKYSEDDDVISYFDKYFKDLAKNGYFDYLEYGFEKREGELFVNKNIQKALENFDYSLSILPKDLAEKMGYEYKIHSIKEKKDEKKKLEEKLKEYNDLYSDDESLKGDETLKNQIKDLEKKLKGIKVRKSGFFIPFSDFKRKIKIYSIIKFFKYDCDYSKDNPVFRDNSQYFLQENEEQFSKLQNEKNEIEKVLNSEDMEKKLSDIVEENISLKRKNSKLTEQNSLLKRNNLDLEIQISKRRDDLNRSKRENGRLKEENKILGEQIKQCQSQSNDFELKNSELTAKYMSLQTRAEQKFKEKNDAITKLTYITRKKKTEFEKFLADYGVVIYNIWRMGRTLEKDSKSNKQYNRVLILLNKSGIKIEEYGDIKDEDRLSSDVTILDVIESSEVQEIIVETVKPSIYYGEKRILEGEVILTKPKN